MRIWDSPLQSLRSAAFLAGAAAALLSANSVLNEFAFDDLPVIVENIAIQDLGTLPGAIASPYWPNEYGQSLGLWRPVTTALFGIQWAIYGGNPAMFHAVNVLLHGVVTALVVLVLAELAPLWLAFVAGLLFAVHPVHVEAVANVVGFAEIFSSALYLAACLIFLRSGSRIRFLPGAAITGLFVLAFLTKESAITLPGVLFLLDGAREDVPLKGALSYARRRWPIYAAIAGAAGLILVARSAVLGSLVNPMAPLGADLLREDVSRIWTVASIWPHYFRLLFFPLDLSADYAPSVVPLAFGWTVSGVLGALLVLGTLGLALRLWGKRTLGRDRHPARLFSFGVVWLVITLSPVSNVLFLSGVLLAERTFYLPSVGFAALLAWIGAELYEQRRRLAQGALVLTLTLMSVRTFTRNAAWRDNFTVFNTLLIEHPESGRAQWLIGDAYHMAGDREAGNAAYRITISLLHGDYSLLVEVGRRLLAFGEKDAAKALFIRAWEDHPDRGIAPQVLAGIYYSEGDYPSAIASAEAARVYYESSDMLSNHLLASSLAAEGRWAESIQARIETIEAGERHRWQQWLWLAEAYVQTGDTARALESLDSARIKVRPPDEPGQIDSVQSLLVGSKNANASQNPASHRR
jgi:tetratricopeptide (TPR) repeat protein